MPEGHAIHRLARDHHRLLRGRLVRVTSPQGRFRGGARRLSGRTVERVEAHGKHLFYWFDRPRLLHVHLGLYGRFRLIDGPPPRPQGQVRVRMTTDRCTLDLNGPNQCEVLAPADRDRLVARLGPDPLRRDADPSAAWRRIGRSRAAIGTLLLDQSVIAGVGNIYRAEVLFLMGIDPRRPGNTLTRDQFDRLWQSLAELMRLGVRHDRLITVPIEQLSKPYAAAPRDERVHIYKKPTCPRCHGPIATWTQAARAIYACTACQR